MSPSPLCTCSSRSATCLNDWPSRSSSVVCSFSSTVARICSSFCALSLRRTSRRAFHGRANRVEALLVRLGELGDPIGNLSHLLVLDAGDALEMVAHRLRLLTENRAELGAQRLARQRLLGARVGQILAHIALEIGAGCGEHLEAACANPPPPERAASREPAIDPMRTSTATTSRATTTSATTTTTTERTSGMEAEFTTRSQRAYV